MLFLSIEFEKEIDKMVSVITGLIQNSLISVILVGSGGVIR